MPLLNSWLIAAAVASAAASAGGTAASMIGQAAVKKKQKAAQNAERARTLATDRQREATVAAAVPQYDRGAQEGQQKSVADQLEQYLAPPPQDTSQEYVAQNPGAPTEVKDSMARQLAGALATGKGYARDLAKVSSYGRLGFDNTLRMNRLGEAVKALNTEQGRSTGLLGTELEGAYGAGVGANNMAGILSGVAGLANAGVGYGVMSKLGGAGQVAGALKPMAPPIPHIPLS
jgi:hypothetical protein